MSDTIILPVIATLIASLLMAVLAAFSLPLARRLYLGWNQVVVRFSPRSVRAARVEETLSHLYELEDDLRIQGYGPGSISLHVLFDLIRSIPDDLTWRPQRAEPDMFEDSRSDHDFLSPSELNVPYPSSGRRAFSVKNSRGVLFFLNSKEVTLRGGKPQRIYYFSRKLGSEAVEALPEGRVVRENPRNGFLTTSKMR